MAILLRRQYGSICYNSDNNAYYCRSSWNSWGRWVALGAILVFFFLLFYLCSCFSARRRRRAGANPYFGTGWAGRAPFGHGQATYNPNYPQQQQQNYSQDVPPTYNQTHGGYYGQDQGYYGGQQTGVEMQPPQGAYRGGQSEYQPPTGPPPNKKGDGVIR